MLDACAVYSSFAMVHWRYNRQIEMNRRCDPDGDNGEYVDGYDQRR
jgi:hypothetical protein